MASAIRRKHQKSKDDTSIEAASTRSGGVNIDAKDVSVSGDVVGRDKIVHIYVNKEHEREPSKIPLELPPRAAHFTDRHEELEKLLRTLKPGEVVTLCGPGGIGKTALAAEALARLTNGGESPPQAFPDGVLFHSFYDQSDVTLALEHFVLSFGEEPRPTAAIAAQRALAGRKALLVLDGAEAADNLEAVLAVRGNCGVLVTSRNRGDAVAEYEMIPPLEMEDAVGLLRAWGGKWTADEHSVRRICEIVGGLPLAVRLAGRYLATQDEQATDYMIWLEDTPLMALDQGERRIESVPILLERSLERVDKVAVEALAVVGKLALAPFDKPVIAAVLEMTDGEAGRALGELVQYGLLLREESGYRASHALVHTYAQQRLEAPEGTLEKLASYFYRFAQDQQDRGKTGYAQMDTARPHIMVLLTQLAESGIWRPIVQLAHVLTRARGEGYLQMRGFWNDEYRCLSKAADACRHLKEETIESQGSDWSRQLANIQFAVGDLLFYQDQYSQAAEAFRESLALYQQIDASQERIAETNLRLGEIYLNRSDFDRALEQFENSLRIYERLGKSGETLAAIYSWLGRTYRRQGSHEKAESSYERSLTYYQNAGNDTESAFVLIRLAALAFDEGEEEKAWNHLRQSEDLVNRSKVRSRSTARVRRELANQYLWRRSFRKAEELYLISLEDFTALDTKPDIAWCLQALGDTCFEMGDYEKAEKNYRTALEYFDELGILHGRGYALDHLGMIKLKQANTAEAREHFTKAFEIFKASGLKDGIGYLLFNLGDVERAEGKWNEALSRYSESLRIWEELGNKQRVSLTEERLEEVSRRIKESEAEAG